MRYYYVKCSGVHEFKNFSVDKELFELILTADLENSVVVAVLHMDLRLQFSHACLHSYSQTWDMANSVDLVEP